MSTQASVTADGGAAQATEAGRTAAAGGGNEAPPAVDGAAQEQHYTEVAENYEAGELAGLPAPLAGTLSGGNRTDGRHALWSEGPPTPRGLCCPSKHHPLFFCCSFPAAFFYSSLEYRDWVLGHLLRHFGLPDEASSCCCCCRGAQHGMGRHGEGWRGAWSSARWHES